MPRPFFRKAFERWLADNRARFTHPPLITERRKGHFTLAFQGITRPRKRLGLKTPHEVFHASLNRVAPRT